jgi:hypothetical protein
VLPYINRQTQDTTSLSALHMRRFRSFTYTLSGSVAYSSGKFSSHTEAFELPLPSSFLQPGSAFTGPVPALTMPARTSEIALGRYLVYSVGSELFPTHKVGIGLGYTHWDDAVSLDRAYDVSASWFVTRSVGLRFAFRGQRIHSFAGEFGYTGMASVQATGRF